MGLGVRTSAGGLALRGTAIGVPYREKEGWPVAALAGIEEMGETSA